MQPDESAFLEAIASNPADETARQAYADWLADRDDPRAEFVRLSADFLRSVRGLGSLRRSAPVEWLEATDPLFNRFGIQSISDLGAETAGTVTEIRIAPGSAITEGQATVLITTWPRVEVEQIAQQSGLVTAVFVRLGETVVTNQPLYAYFSGQGKFALRTPRAPMLAFIHSLESQRKTLRQNPQDLNEAMLARHATALDMVFGSQTSQEARIFAARNRGWDIQSVSLDERMRQVGHTADQIMQERIDVHIEMLRVLLARHGQPDGFHEPSAPTSGE